MVAMSSNDKDILLSCGAAGPAEYIPTWPALSWMMNLMVSRDKPCTKLIRSKQHRMVEFIIVLFISESDWTRKVKTDGYYDNGNII